MVTVDSLEALQEEINRADPKDIIVLKPGIYEVPDGTPMINILDSGIEFCGVYVPAWGPRVCIHDCVFCVEGMKISRIKKSKTKMQWGVALYLAVGASLLGALLLLYLSIVNNF